jgi:two-component system, OmpR family, response regulator
MSGLLVVDDEERIRKLLRRVFEHEGFAVDTAATGTEALAMAARRDHDLVVLDLMLPDIPGSEILGGLLESNPAARVLVLSAAPEIGSRVQVLDMGALDFLAKPFAIAELLARVRARLREGPHAAAGHTVEVGDLRLDTQRHELHVGGRRIPLSHREFVLLGHLMRRAGQVCSREELLADVWGYTFDPGSNVVDVYIRRLRAKLGLARIETVRNVGYSLTAG